MALTPLDLQINLAQMGQVGKEQIKLSPERQQLANKNVIEELYLHEDHQVNRTEELMEDGIIIKEKHDQDQRKRHKRHHQEEDGPNRRKLRKDEPFKGNLVDIRE